MREVEATGDDQAVEEVRRALRIERATDPVLILLLLWANARSERYGRKARKAERCVVLTPATQKRLDLLP